ncbi:hypothetical protein C5167_028730 [Papaver somniferum]|nr:hypothetical protein C5167_028730 [Papaver somniferum]
MDPVILQCVQLKNIGKLQRCLIDMTVFFGEYECFGPGSNFSSRVAYSKQPTQFEVNPFLDVSYIEGNDWLLLGRHGENSYTIETNTALASS